MVAASTKVRAISPPADTVSGTKEKIVAETPSAGGGSSSVVSGPLVVGDVFVVVPVGEVVVVPGREVVVVLLDAGVVVLLVEGVVVVLLVVVVLVGAVVVVVLGSVVVVDSTIVAVVVSGADVNPSMSMTVRVTVKVPVDPYLWLTVAPDRLALLPSPKSQRYSTIRPPSENAVPLSWTFSPTTPV
jgi:hypothetical protein